MPATIANTRILNENITYSFPPDLILPTVVFQPEVEVLPISPFEDLFEKKTAELTESESFVLPDHEILIMAKKYYEENRETLLKKYRDKFIAIFNNEVVDSDKNFSKLASRVYKKFGYQTIYMPFITAKEKIVKIPSPRIRIF
ncbi:MAG: hypothetical protein HZA30_03190 [Candidatus Omnitrophica bacterium]|nr:hypothetical protein [Candidatus Omnitrophota bacterium]